MGPQSSKYVRRCDEISQADLGLVGMKSFGIRMLIDAGVSVPPGFALTIGAFREFLDHNGLRPLVSRLKSGRGQDLSLNSEALAEIRHAAEAGEVPPAIREELSTAVRELDRKSNCLPLRLAVRSSCNYEDLPGISFAGMYQSLLNISPASLLQSIAACYASLYSPRSIAYLQDHDTDLEEVAMGVLIQELVDAEAAGTIFTAEANSGFDGLHHVEGVWGFGEGVVAGQIVPNSWSISKRSGRIIGRSLGEIQKMHIAEDGIGLKCVAASDATRDAFCLNDDEVCALGRTASRLEELQRHPLDIEWVKARDGRLLFLQMRPLSVRRDEFFTKYTLCGESDNKPLLKGLPITQKAVCGRIRINPPRRFKLEKDDILVVRYLDLDWLPLIRNAGGIIIETGGYTSHIAIILREHGIPSLFGAEGASARVSEGQLVTLVCSANEGFVWDGDVKLTKETIDVRTLPQPRHKICVVTSTLTNIDQYLRLPVAGIGLVRLEFLIHNDIGIHPLALIDYDNGAPQRSDLKLAIEQRTHGFQSKREFYIQKLTEGICAIACRCPDKLVNVRAPDFIIGDYLTLLGGPDYEHEDETNPMMGWRGTSRLIDERYVAAFEMDCEAFRRAIDVHGFKNVNILVPFCRTPSDAVAIKAILKAKGPADARIGMMVEVPSNVMLAKQFAAVFDFFLVGPMDLTQLTYGADRTAWRMSRYCNETEAVKEMVKHFFHNIRDCNKDVFIGGWPLFQYLEEYNQVKGNNRIHLVELPDRLLELFESVRRLEETLGGDQ